MSPSPSERVRRVLRWTLALSIYAWAVLLVVAAAVGSFGHVRTQLLLSCVGLALGAGLADFQLGMRREFPRRVLVGLLAIALSQACYHLLVWTGWRTHPVLWRLWWVSAAGAVNVSHLLALRAAADRRGWVERATAVCAVVSTVMVAALALRKDLLAGLPSVCLWVGAVPVSGAVLGSLWVWGRWARRKAEPLTVSRRAKLAWILLSHVAIFVVGFYVGRRAPSPEAAYYALPSALAHLPRAAMHAQMQADLVRLRAVAAGLEEFEARMEGFHSALRSRLDAEGRDYYRPEEDDELRWLFVTYLSYRAELLRLIATYSGFAALRDAEARARCFMLGFGATTTAFEAGLKLVRAYRDRPVERRKLNEAEPSWGIPAGMFDRIYEAVASGRNVELCAEMAAYFDLKRSGWRGGRLWPEADFDWLETRTLNALTYLRQHQLSPHRAWVELFVERVKQDAYSPAYAVQSVVAEWIGDTRVVERPPLISRAQAEALQARLKPGDIVLERRNWFLSNAFLPGFWPHAALYVGRLDDLRRLGIADEDAVRERLKDYLDPAPDGSPRTVLEALSEGVVFSSVGGSMQTDYVAVLRPRLSERQIAQAIVRAFRHHGKPYDFEFDFFTSDKIVCTELVYRAYEGMLHFDLERVMGRPTLPGVAIVRKFARERRMPERELDFVLFLDGEGAAGCARFADEEALCASADRPGEFHQ